ncbi:MAG: fumarate/nitrate reduction transcriptional regulator Fnr [Thiotrichales bacterium]|nr:fumarate/nitrate reduction transcriptional regulator Fnr [Thiotrichales bacterium]
MKEVKSSFHVSCKNCGLQKVCFPTGLNREDVERLDNIVDRRPPLKKGVHLFQAGDSFNALFAIRAGVIKLYSFTDNGEEIVHGFYLPGDVLGIDALGSRMHQYNAMALDTTSVCTLPFEKLNELSENIPNLSQQILNVISKEVLDGRMHSELLIRRNADQRVAQFIYNMSERHRHRGYAGSEFRLSILHRDVAVYLGLTPETVSRILAKFHADEIVTWKKKEVFIHNMHRLQDVIGMHHECEKQTIDR